LTFRLELQAAAAPNEKEHYPQMNAFKHILVPTDFSACSLGALDLAISLAATFDADLTLLHCWEVPIYPYLDYMLSSPDLITSLENAATKRLAEELEWVKKQHPGAKSALSMGLAWQQILEVAKQLRPDLIVMGSHGRHGLDHVLLGSVAEKVVRLSEVPVLTVRAPRKKG